MRPLITWHRKAKRAWLVSAGFTIGDRDPTINSSFEGRYMVVEDASRGPSECASGMGWRVVGDNLDELIDAAFDAMYPDEGAKS